MVAEGQDTQYLWHVPNYLIIENQASDKKIGLVLQFSGFCRCLVYISCVS